MEYKCLQYEVREHVAHVTLNRPDRLNALNAEISDELKMAAEAIAADSGVRAALLTGAGRAFCSGADLMHDPLLDEGQSLGKSVGLRMRENFNPMIDAWYELPVPVVTAVNGVAAGAGMSLALIGDIVIAARSASFIQLFAPKVGLMPDLGSSYFLPRLIGGARAKGLALLGEPLTAENAERWGLIWECVADEDLPVRTVALARRLAGGATQAFKRIKSVFNREPAQSLTEQLELEALMQAELGDTEDFAEGVRAFRAKRPPQFAGR